MARLNITVPDDLFKQLEKHRDRINMSRICAQALEKKVAEIGKEAEILELLRREVGNMTSMINRLKGEKADRMRVCFEQGVDAARNWVQEAPYSELKSWGVKSVILLDQAQELTYSPPLPEDVEASSNAAGNQAPTDLDEAKEFATGFYWTAVAHWQILEPKL